MPFLFQSVKVLNNILLLLNQNARGIKWLLSPFVQLYGSFMWRFISPAPTGTAARPNIIIYVEFSMKSNMITNIYAKVTFLAGGPNIFMMSDLWEWARWYCNLIHGPENGLSDFQPNMKTGSGSIVRLVVII